MKKYKIHFDQVNAMWIDVEASSPNAALNKAIKERKLYYPEPDAIEYPNGKEQTIYEEEL